MKTVLRVGQKVDIHRVKLVESGIKPDGTDIEGTATLIKLLQKSHTTNPPYETWLVAFDDDETPVERHIPVRLPQFQSYGMSSSLARSPVNRQLLEFMVAAGLSDDWADSAWIPGLSPLRYSSLRKSGPFISWHESRQRGRHGFEAPT